MTTKNIMIVGVGGQGTLLTSRILGGLAIEAGYDVKLSEVHGMAQRGGSVITYVKYGEKVHSPIVAKGTADIILAFEMLEGFRYLDYLKKDGVLIVNSQTIDPMPVITAEDSEEVKQWKRQLLQKIKEEENVVTLYNVLDTRTEKIHSVAIVSEKNVKWFIPIVKEETEAE